MDELTAIVHPPVTERIRSEIASMAPGEIAVLDIPLLAESPFQAECDRLVFVEASISIRESRARAARGWSEGEVARREGMQASLAEKRARAHLIVRNEGTLDDVRRGAARAWERIVRWRKRQEAGPPGPEHRPGPLGAEHRPGPPGAEHQEEQ